MLSRRGASHPASALASCYSANHQPRLARLSGYRIRGGIQAVLHFTLATSTTVDEGSLPTHYCSPSARFTLLERPATPSWRPSQLGALNALLAHWIVQGTVPAIVCIPTGTGKSAIATAAPYLQATKRVLVIVPTRDLREQIAAEFEHETTLRGIRARRGKRAPVVRTVVGRIHDWSELVDADVVIGIPNSISPSYYTGKETPPPDFFDLIIVDEAHHAPAATWNAVLSHFTAARSLLLTATPQRRDGERLPGEMVFHYPLRRAIEDGTYKAVQQRLVPVSSDLTRGEVDELIAREVVALAGTVEHESSAILVRAATIARAKKLAALYTRLGLDTAVLSSAEMTSEKHKEIINGLRSGQTRAVAVVDMLGEGFDLPRLRIAAYHDKHKSVAPTVQLIGRLARVHADYPQESIIVAAEDADIYPQLKGAVRELWRQDADWARVLPGLIDDEVTNRRADQEFAALLESAPPELVTGAIRPTVRATLYETVDPGWEPAFTTGEVPAGLQHGRRIHGRHVFYVTLTPTRNSILVITAATARPKWHPAPGMDWPAFELHIITWRRAAGPNQTGILAVNTEHMSVAQSLLTAIGAGERFGASDPQRLQTVFDNRSQFSVSNAGVRNTHRGSPGVPTYKTFAGNGIDNGLRDADTGNSALGHAMVRVDEGSVSFMAGFATSKGKFWELRHVALRKYEDRINEYIEHYWNPPPSGRGRLLPGVPRGTRLNSFPTAPIVAIEFDQSVHSTQDWRIDGFAVSDLLFQADAIYAAPERLSFAAYTPTDIKRRVWQGFQDTLGRFHSTQPAVATLGFGIPQPFEDILADRPPIIYFMNRYTVHGSTLYEASTVRDGIPPQLRFYTMDWFADAINIRAETQRTADRSNSVSIDSAFEKWLIGRPQTFRHRWIISNDGAREFADYLVVEVEAPRGGRVRIRLELWHAKASTGDAPAVRLEDMLVVTAQAMKSRQWITNRSFWSELGRRLIGAASPKAVVIEGRPLLLEILCGLRGHEAYSFERFTPTVECGIGIVQPGLSISRLHDQLASKPTPVAAQQIVELLTVCHDAIGNLGELMLLGSS